MTHYRTRDPYYKAARRAYHALLRKHSMERMEEALFVEGDRALAPEFYERPEPQFGNASLDIEARLLVAVADVFGLDTTLFDDMLCAADWDEAARSSYALPVDVDDARP